tara:strand:- start:9578 stop:13129 length:3552 start_codon:yes stop_codon:yes gene_type:complete
MATEKEQKAINALLKEEIKLITQLQQLVKQGEGSGPLAIRTAQQKNAVQSKLNKLLDVTDKGYKKISSSAEDLLDDAKNTQKVFVSLAGQMKGIGGNTKAAVKHMDAFETMSDATLQNADRIKQLAEKNRKLQSDMPKLGGAALESAKRLVISRELESNALASTQGVMSDIADEALLAGNALASNGAILQESLTTAYARQRVEEAESALAQNRSSMSAKSLASAKQAVAEARAGVNVLQAQADVVDYQISQREALTSAILGPFESLKSTIESFPGGTFLSGALGLDVFEGQMNRIVQESVQAGLTGGVDGGIAKFKSLTATTKVFGMSLKSAMLPLLAVGAIVGALMLFKQMSAETEELSKNTGQSAVQSEKMLQSARGLQASSKNSLANTEEIVGAMTALKEQFGSTANFSGETAVNISNMSSAFGIAVGDAAAVQRQFEAMGQSSAEAFNTQALTANLSEAAGVAPGKVMADIAKSSKAAAKYMGGNAKQLTKAAVEAARLGMELGDMVSIADGLLDIESSIEAEFEASVMLGKTINMDLARQLALQGDIEGATKAVLDQVGSIHDFNKLDVLQRKKLAQAAGMEVGQLQDALQKQEQMNNLTAEQKKRYDEAAKALEGGTLSGEDLVKQQEAALAAKQMGASFDKIKNTLMKALYPIIKAITGIFTNVLAPILDVVGGIFKGFMFALSPVLLVFKGIAKVVGFLAPALKVIAGIIGGIYAVKALIWAGDKANMAILKTREFFSSKEQMYTMATNAAKSMGLITDKQAVVQKKIASGFSKDYISDEAMANSLKQKGLFTKIKENLQMSYIQLKQKLGIGLSGTEQGLLATKLGLKGTEAQIENQINASKSTGIMHTVRETAMQVALAVKKAAVWTWETLTNKEKMMSAALTLKETVQQGLLAIAKGAVWLWQTMTAVAATATATATGTQAAASAAAIAPTAALATTHGAAATAALTTASASTLGVGIAPILAAVGIGVGVLFALMAGASAMMSDGVIPPAGGGKGGFGSRTMFGPEGAISFNNKDTIVAGTDLFKANDAAFGPEGSMSMSDQGPGQVEITDIKKKAFKKLVVANMIGSSPMGMLMGGLGAIGGGLGSMLGGDEEGEEGGKPVYDVTASEKLDLMLGKLDEVVTAIASGKNGGGGGGQPVQIVIGNKVIEELQSQMNVNKSYNVSAGNGGEE